MQDLCPQRSWQKMTDNERSKIVKSQGQIINNNWKGDKPMDKRPQAVAVLQKPSKQLR